MRRIHSTGNDENIQRIKDSQEYIVEDIEKHTSYHSCTISISTSHSFLLNVTVMREEQFYKKFRTPVLPWKWFTNVRLPWK
jgi:hypothetical protein